MGRHFLPWIGFRGECRHIYNTVHGVSGKYSLLFVRVMSHIQAQWIQAVRWYCSGSKAKNHRPNDTLLPYMLPALTPMNHVFANKKHVLFARADPSFDGLWDPLLTGIHWHHRSVPPCTSVPSSGSAGSGGAGFTWTGSGSGIQSYGDFTGTECLHVSPDHIYRPTCARPVCLDLSEPEKVREGREGT